MTTPLERIAVWLWDHALLHRDVQNAFADRFPVLATRLDDLAHRRDRELVTNRSGRRP